MAYSNTKAAAGFWATVKEMAWLLLIVFLIRTFIFGLYQVPSGSMETTMLIGERFFADKFTYLFSKPQRNDIISLNDPEFQYSSNPVVRTYQEYVGWPIWPLGPSNWTKRIIGVPGDHIKGVIEDGKPVVYRNGVKIDEPYLNSNPLLAVADAAFQHIDWKTYVPTEPYESDKQYHRIHQDRIIHAEQLSPQFLELIKDNTTFLPDGRMLKEPFKPIAEHGDYKKVELDGSYWTRTDEFDIHLGPTHYWLMGDNRRGSKDSRFFGPVDGRLIHGRILYRLWSSDSEESWWIVDLIKHPIDFFKRMRWHRFFQRIK
jgi:signal peptidase I